MVVAVEGAHVVAVADGGLDAAVVAGGQWCVRVAVAAAGG